MKLLITGAKGLIGTALCQELRECQIIPRGFDHHYPSHNPEHGDILNSAHLKEAVKDCVGIVHLAAVSRVIWGERDPELCWKTNYEGTLNVIQAALSSPAKPWILYASSREVYGRPEHLPVREEAPLKPINIYGESKAAAEIEILKAREKGLSTAIVRFSNVYGSIDDHPDRVLPAFCRAAAIGDSLRVEGKDNTFDFTHLHDTVEGTLKIIQHLVTQKHALPPLHLTTGQATSLETAAMLAMQAGGNRSAMVEAPSRHFDVSHFRGDASMTMELLKWRPHITVEEGIRVLTYLFKQALSIPKKEGMAL